jgi:LytS/YehU family sensor histidine kinase
MGLLLLLFLQQDTLAADSTKVDPSISDEVSMAVLLGLLPVVLGFSFIMFVVYRSRREAEVKKRETEYRLSKAEGDLKALRAQINPHFIFNSLNSIHHFILKQNSEQASAYLIKFSKLIRYVLESSEKTWVSLEEELEANDQYLELERLRMENSFEFQVEIAENVVPENTFIPPMLIQPFLENAVWHGLSREGRIQLKIQKSSPTYLECLISDEGLARVEKEPFDLSNMVKKSSLGIHLMEERFKTLNQWRELEAGYEFEELKEGGRQVILKIPYEEE